MSKVMRKCDNCGKEYKVKNSDLKRGWGRCCSKSCAAFKREKSRPNYNPERVKTNNLIREGSQVYPELENYDPGDSEYWESKDY